jgi:hypothetical protein
LVDQQSLRNMLRLRHGIRIEEEMAAYLLRRLAEAGADGGAIPVLGCDARTGVPLRKSIPVDLLQAEPTHDAPEAQ